VVDAVVGTKYDGIRAAAQLLQNRGHTQYKKAPAFAIGCDWFASPT